MAVIQGATIHIPIGRRASFNHVFSKIVSDQYNKYSDKYETVPLSPETLEPEEELVAELIQICQSWIEKTENLIMTHSSHPA